MSRSILLLVIFVSSNCSTKTKQNHRDVAFIEFKKSVSEKVFSKFPLSETIDVEQSSSQIVIQPASLYAAHYCGIFISFEYDSSKYYQNVNRLSTQKIFESRVYDQCNLFVVYQDSTRRDQCSTEYLPVPNISDTFNSLYKVDFDLESKFLVFESKKGNFVNSDPEFVTDEDISNSIRLQNGWADGFSNGAILNPKSKEIIYWIVIW
jgi:hypothetical protein